MGLSFFRSQQKGKPWVVCFFFFLPFGARCHMQPPCMQMGDILRRGLSVICKYPLCLGNFTEAAATAGHEPWGKLPMVGAFSRISASRKGFWWNKNVHTSQRSVFFPENMGPSWCQWLSWCDGGARRAARSAGSAPACLGTGEKGRRENSRGCPARGCF